MGRYKHQVFILIGLLLKLTIFLNAQAIEVTVSGSATGNRADSSVVRSAALTNALINASEVSGFKIESSSLLINETDLVSSVEVNTSAEIDNYEVISEGWSDPNIYSIEVKVELVPDQRENQLRKTTEIAIILKGSGEIDQIARRLSALISAYGITVNSRAEDIFNLTISSRVLPEAKSIHYADQNCELIANLSEDQTVIASLSARGFGLTDDLALISATDRLIYQMSEKIAEIFSEKILGNETTYTLHLEGDLNSTDLMSNFQGISWIRNPELLSQNAAVVAISLSTNRHSFSLIHAMETWGFQLKSRKSTMLEFIKRNTHTRRETRTTMNDTEKQNNQTQKSESSRYDFLSSTGFFFIITCLVIVILYVWLRIRRRNN